MKKNLLYITLLFTLQVVQGQIPLTSLLTIEQGAIDLNSFEFWLEKDGKTSQYFNYDGFSSQRVDNFYSNTNLFAFTDRFVQKGKYTLNVKLVTPDSTYHHQTDIDLTVDVLGASIVSLIGKSKKGKVYLKDLRIVRHIEPQEQIQLKAFQNLELNKSPVFEIVSDLNATIYPYNHFGHFYGNIYTKTDDKWKTYGYVQPYQKFDCKPEHMISNDTTKKCFFSIKQDCSREQIKEKGEYKFKIDVGTDEIDSKVPNNYVESGTLRLRKFEYYTLEYVFNIN